MAELNKTGAQTKYSDPTTGLFRTNANGEIGAVDLQSFLDDIWDSFGFKDTTSANRTVAADLNDGDVIAFNDTEKADLNLFREYLARINVKYQESPTKGTTLTAAQSGRLIYASGSDSKSFTLPALNTVTGDYLFVYHFVYARTSAATGGDITINLNSASDYGIIQPTGDSIRSSDASIFNLITLVGANFTNGWIAMGGFGTWTLSDSVPSVLRTINYGTGSGGASGISARTNTTILLDANYRHSSRSTPETGNLTFDFTGAVAGSYGSMYHNDTAAPTISQTGTGTVQAKSTYEYVPNSLNTILWWYDGETVIYDNDVGNTAPIATGISISGTFQEGQTLTASYTYNDPEDLEDTTATIYRWYYASDTTGTGQTLITTTTSATVDLTATQVGNVIGVSVQPFAQTGVTTGVISDVVYDTTVVTATTAGSDFQSNYAGSYTTVSDSDADIYEILDANIAVGAAVVLPDVNDRIRVTLTVPTTGNYTLRFWCRAGNSSNPSAYGGGYTFYENGSSVACTLITGSIGASFSQLGSSTEGYFESDSTVSLTSGINTFDVEADLVFGFVSQIEGIFVS